MFTAKTGNMWLCMKHLIKGIVHNENSVIINSLSIIISIWNNDLNFGSFSCHMTSDYLKYIA